MNPMKVWIPPGTLVQQVGSSVIIHFHREHEADEFCAWLVWMDKQPSGAEMIISKPEEKNPKQ